LKKKLTTDIHPPISHPAAEVKTNNSPVAIGNRLIITHFMFYFVPKSYCRYAAISYNKAIVLPAKYDSKPMPYDVRCIIIDFVHYNYNMLYFETLITKWFIHYMHVHNINVRSFNAIDNVKLQQIASVFLSQTGKLRYIYFQIKIAEMTLKVHQGHLVIDDSIFHILCCNDGVLGPINVLLQQQQQQQQQQQYLFAIGGWKPEGHKPIRAGSKKK